ncbi:MAG: GNAT family acetyltransferase [Tissierellia bacterium]|nr:GNAT family acetyltransferase [Tissierellia bacterium]
MEYSYRLATLDDVEGVYALQQLFHVSTIAEEDKKDGFVTTLFTKEQLISLITEEQGISLALKGDTIIGYAMAASWHYWSQWPFFQHMIEELPKVTMDGKEMTVDNSYQYGPVCVAKEERGHGVFQRLFWFSLKTMINRFPYMLTFVNHINPRSYKAHVEKVGLLVLRDFEYNNNTYWEMGIPTKEALHH